LAMAYPDLVLVLVAAVVVPLHFRNQSPTGV
jgi:hypothetical protein